MLLFSHSYGKNNTSFPGKFEQCWPSSFWVRVGRTWQDVPIQAQYYGPLILISLDLNPFALNHVRIDLGLPFLFLDMALIFSSIGGGAGSVVTFMLGIAVASEIDSCRWLEKLFQFLFEELTNIIKSCVWYRKSLQTGKKSTWKQNWQVSLSLIESLSVLKGPKQNSLWWVQVWMM